MAAKRQSVAETLADVTSRRPVLEPVLRAFEPLLSAGHALAGKLADPVREAGLRLPELQWDRAQQGVSLLAGVSLTGIAGPMRQAAEELLPLLTTIEAVAPHADSLRAFFLRPVEADDSRDALAEAVVAGRSIESIARDGGVEPGVLAFVTGFVVSPVLHAMVAAAVPEEGDAPWDTGGAWQQGYCPVCGAFPTIAWLDKPILDDKNAYLAGGGGKKHLHCSMCGAAWKFLRGACPSCGKEVSGTMEMLRETEAARGERLDWCTKCNTYCPTVDLREREAVPNLDALALGMMHLDMVAARKKLRPLRPSFWNMY
ncbi:formate dehydrogenase accessory protein FdhE [Nitratidesulfovibrio sp. D1]|uniref:formate dehydrogenase accessory protein FdhE n=1 Tax=Nitratidesulfovibrio sp. D1 TaxID=3440151 RepID=UPI003EBA0B25